MSNNQKQSMFLLEENIIRTYAIMQAQLFGIIQNSKFTIGELAKLSNMDRATFSKRFKEQLWTAKELYELLNLLNQEFSNKFDQVTKD